MRMHPVPVRRYQNFNLRAYCRSNRLSKVWTLTKTAYQQNSLYSGFGVGYLTLDKCDDFFKYLTEQLDDLIAS